MSVGISEDGSYGFVEFATEELASTAFEFGNTVFLERPMKIDRPMKFIPTGCVPPMDVMPLRLTGRIPMTQNVSAHNINVPTAQTLLAANVQVPGGTARLRKYIDVNQLDGSSSSRMLSLSSLEAEWVMDRGRNDSESGLANPKPTASLSRLGLGCIDATDNESRLIYSHLQICTLCKLAYALFRGFRKTSKTTGDRCIFSKGKNI